MANHFGTKSHQSVFSTNSTYLVLGQIFVVLCNPGTYLLKCHFLLRCDVICHSIMYWSRIGHFQSLNMNVPNAFEGSCEQWHQKQRADQAGLVLACIFYLRLLQERGLCGVIFAQMHFQACSKRFLKDLQQKWQVRHGPVVLQHLFIQIRLLYQWSNMCLFKMWLWWSKGSSTFFSRFIGSGTSSQDFDGDFITTTQTSSWVAGLKYVKCWPSNMTSALITMVMISHFQ